MPPGGSGNFPPVPTAAPPPTQSMNYDYPGPSATRPPMANPQMGFRPNGPGQVQQTPPRPVPAPGSQVSADGWNLPRFF